MTHCLSRRTALPGIAFSSRARWSILGSRHDSRGHLEKLPEIRKEVFQRRALGRDRPHLDGMRRKWDHVDLDHTPADPVDVDLGRVSVHEAELKSAHPPVGTAVYLPRLLNLEPCEGRELVLERHEIPLADDRGIHAG